MGSYGLFPHCFMPNREIKYMELIPSVKFTFGSCWSGNSHGNSQYLVQRGVDAIIKLKKKKSYQRDFRSFETVQINNLVQKAWKTTEIN